MAEDKTTHKHDASDKKLDHDATEARAAAAKPHPHPTHDPDKTARHDDDGKDRLFEGRVQRDDADKESDRNRLEKDVAKHHHDAETIIPISDHDRHKK